MNDNKLCQREMYYKIRKHKKKKKKELVFQCVKCMYLVDKFFLNGSLAASPLHPHPSLVLILSHTRWTVRITQP